MADYDPHGIPVPIPEEPAGCPPNPDIFKGNGPGNPIPRRYIARFLVGLVPFIGPSLVSICFKDASNDAAFIEAQQTLLLAQTAAMEAFEQADEALKNALQGLISVTTGDSPGQEGYVTLLAKRTAQQLNQRIFMILINCAFLLVMVVAVVWAM